MSQINLNQVKNIALLVFIIIIGFLAYQLRSTSQNLAEVQQLNSSLEDTLTIRKNKEGLFVARIAVLETYKTETFTKLATQDTLIQKLQTLVLQYKKELKKKGSVTVVHTDGAVDVTVPTVVDTTTHHIVYNSTFNKNGWVWGSISASKEQTTLNLKFKEEMDVIIGEESTGFLGLGKKKTFVDVILHNPYNSVNAMRTYAVKPPPIKRYAFGPTAAYGVGEGFEPQFFIGVGLTYSLIRF